MNEYDKKSKKYCAEIEKQKEKTDHILLNLEIVVGIIVLIYFLEVVIIISSLFISNFIKVMLIIFNTIMLFIVALYMLVIEQNAGYYECTRCNHKYVPTYLNMLFALHVGRVRYMKCPMCKQKSWQKKVISKQ